MGGQAEALLLGSGPVGDVATRRDAPPRGLVDAGTLPEPYDLRRVALSHAHVAFPPTGYDRETGQLHRVLTLPGAGPVGVAVRQRGRRLEAWATTQPSLRLGGLDEAALRAQLRRVLAADDDLLALRRVAREAATSLPVVADAVALGGGRSLRSPMVWEDLVVTLLSTNCSLAAARSAARRLVRALGDRGAAGEIAFPTPAAVAAVDVDALASATGAGYRAPALSTLARDVASGRVDPEGWLAPGAADERGLSDEEVLAAVRGLRGFGPFSAQSVLGLLGRPWGLALDGWARARLARLLGRGTVTGAEVAERYAPLGRWAGTGLRLELTAGWFDAVPRAGSASARDGTAA